MTLNLTAYAELLRSDVRTQKVAIITEVMGFTETEDAAFWPIYREYDAEMAKLGDERVALIAEYASNYSSLTDAIAEKLADQGARPGGAAAGPEGEVLRSRQDSAVAAHGAAFPAGRASVAAADRPANLGLASHRQVTGGTGCVSERRSSAGVAAVLVSGSSVSLSADRVRLRSGKVVEGMFIGGDSKSVRVLLDNGQRLRDPARRRGGRRVLGAEAQAAPAPAPAPRCRQARAAAPAAPRLPSP